MRTHVSKLFDDYAASGDQLASLYCCLLSLRWPRRGWITAVRLWRAFFDEWWTAFSPSWTLRRTLHVTLGSTTRHTSASRPALAASSWTHPVLTGYTCLPLPTKPSAPVSCQRLAMDWWVGISSATTFQLHATTDCATNTTPKHWRWCFRSDHGARVKQSAIHCDCNYLTRVLQKSPENLLVQSLLHLIMHRVLEATA